MPTKPAKRTTLGRQEQYVVFKTTFETYKSYMEGKNYIGAAVIAFSILEDRVNTMHIVRLKHEGKPIPEGHTSFGKQLKYLLKFLDIDQTTLDSWMVSADKRNELFHKAMFNLDTFNATVCNDFLKQARAADKARRDQKKKLKM